MNRLHNEKEGFLIKGFAVDVNQVMSKAKVCLAPIRFGAGLKGKLVDAMQNGTPCAMTSLAAEGIFGDLQVNGFVEDNPELFAKKAVKLFLDENLWSKKQNNGFEVVSKRFNKVNFETEFLKQIEITNQQLNKKRINNFTGQMLQHHTLQSTKFMSKWIEEKNKR